MAFRSSVVFVSLCLAVTACRPDLANLPCERDDNCPTGLRCVAQRCTSEGGSAGGASAGGSSSAGGRASAGGTAGGRPAAGGAAGGLAGGAAAGGSAAGGSAGGSAGGMDAGGAAGGGDAGGSAGGNAGGGSSAGGVAGGSSAGGSTAGGSTGGGSTAGGGAAGGGSTAGGAAGGSVFFCPLIPTGGGPAECAGGRQLRNPTPLSVANVEWAASGDVDRDCNPDLLLQEGPGPSTLWLLRGRGDGTFNAPQNVGAATFEPTLVDFNGDGLLDIAISGFTAPARVGVMLNLDGGAFTPMLPITAGLATGSALGIAVGDIDGDGVQDDIATGTDDWNSTVDGVVMRGAIGRDGGVELRDTFSFGSVKIWSAAVADLDQDGGRDIVFGRFTYTGGVSVVRSSGGVLSMPDSYSAPASGYPIVVRVGDVTGDGWNDIVGALWGTGQVAVWANQRNGLFNNLPAVTSLGYSGCNASSGCLWGLTVVDLNRDGRADALVPGTNDNRLSVLLSVDGGFASVTENYTVADAGTRPKRSTSADFNRDGRPDVIVTSENAPTMLFTHCP